MASIILPAGVVRRVASSALGETAAAPAPLRPGAVPPSAMIEDVLDVAVRAERLGIGAKLVGITMNELRLIKRWLTA